MTYNPNAWETLPANWNNNAEGWPEHRLDILDVFLGLLPVDSILEIACCTGHYIRELRKLSFVGDYLGIDITPRFIEQARMLSPKEGFGIQDARSLIIYGKYEVVLATGILMHLTLEDGWKALRDWIACSKRYIILSYYSGDQSKEVFSQGFYHNVIARSDIEAILNENEQITTYNIVGRFATCLIEKTHAPLHS